MGRHTFILILVALGTAAATVEGWRHARASAPVSGPIIVEASLSDAVRSVVL
jgi:hypothetical protein